MTKLPRDRTWIDCSAAPRRRWRLVAAALVLFATGGASAEGYELGHGLNLGPFNFAGYGNVSANLPERETKRLVLDDLSLYVTGHVSTIFNPFLETELTGLGFEQDETANRPGLTGRIVLERLYNDTYLTESLTLRIGKMLAPVGAWNQIHAAPLVLSTVRPAATQRNFAAYVSGASLQYSDAAAKLPDVQIYVQPDKEFAHRPDGGGGRRYTTVEGVHVTFPLSLLDKVGFSFQANKQPGGSDQQLLGLDFHYTLSKFTLEGESTASHHAYRTDTGLRHLEYGGYLAGSYALDDQWSVTAWYETFADRAAVSTAHDFLAGITYRPHPAIVGKLEYLQNVGGTSVNPTGLYASWSILF
jgi:hypothetical protein